MKVKVTDLQTGDVITNNGINMVVVHIENNEGVGSCSYDRSYGLVDLQEFIALTDNYQYTTLGDFKTLLVTKLTGTSVPIVEKPEDIAPFEITEITAFSARRKKKIIKTEWE